MDTHREEIPEKETEIIIKPKNNSEAIMMLSANKMKWTLWELKHNFWRTWKHDESSLNLDTLKERISALLYEHGISDELLEDE